MSHFTLCQYQLFKKTTGVSECSIKILSYAASLTHAEVSKISLNCCKHKRFKKYMYLRTNISEAIGQNSSQLAMGLG